MSIILPYINWSGVTNYFAIVNITYQDGYTVGTAGSPSSQTGFSAAPATVENPTGIPIFAGIKSCDIQLYSDANTPTNLLISLPAITNDATSLAPVYSLCNPGVTYTVGTDDSGNPTPTVINDQIYSSNTSQNGNYIVVSGSYMDAGNYKFPSGSLRMGLSTMTSTALQALNKEDNIFDTGLGTWAWVGIGVGILFLVLLLIGIVYFAFFRKKKDKVRLETEDSMYTGGMRV